MKLSPSILFLKGTVLGWDGPWDGVNVLTDDVLQSNDLMELNRDPKLTFIGRVKQKLREFTAVKRPNGYDITHKKISKVMDMLQKR